MQLYRNKSYQRHITLLTLDNTLDRQPQHESMQDTSSTCNGQKNMLQSVWLENIDKGVKK